MENKILVEINVPILEQKYDCFIPVGKTVYQVTKLLAKGISELSGGAYENDNPILYNYFGKKINTDSLIKDSEISNGSKVIML